MILRDLLTHFDISADLPKYLYDESFNDVFLKGNLSFDNDTYKIVIETQKKVIHSLTICESDDYPVCVLSELPNGALNGIKFGRNSGELTYI